MKAGIELMNIYCGAAAINVDDLAKLRGLDNDRFSKLLMKQKTVPLIFEDPISNSVNAAMPILNRLSEEEKKSIDMVITCTESGIDFGKSMSTYIHHYLGLKKNCRLFEIKNACYSGTAGFQMAINFVLSQTAPNKKVLVIATDIMRMNTVHGLTMDMTFGEPSTGSGAIAMLISNKPDIFQVDNGANGYYGYEVMDTCRPVPDTEAGDVDLSLLSYLDCCENTFLEYQKRVDGVDYEKSFDYLAFHTPFGGMVKGAHRSNMRKFHKMKPEEIEHDFEKRVMPSINYCQRVGNIMGATTHLALASAIDNGHFDRPKRIGIFSYGSGCCSEFYSGVVTPAGQEKLKSFNLDSTLNNRYMMSMKEYEDSFQYNDELKFGTRNYKVNTSNFSHIFKEVKGKNKLILSGIKEFHREYEWV